MPRTKTSVEGRMPLLEHLHELRQRLVRIVIGLLVGSVAGWFFADPTMDLLFGPIQQVAAQRHQDIAPNFAGVTTPFDMKVRVAVFLAVLGTSPWWIYQVWAFVTPGLTRKERRMSLGFVAVAVPLFLAGALLAWRVIPNAVYLLTLSTPDGAVNFIDAQTYLTFITQIVVALGLIFLLPLFMVGLNIAGLVTARTWLRAWRWAILAGFFFAALISPTPDVISMFAIAVPIIALYFLAVGICALNDRRRSKRAHDEGTGNE